MKGNQGETQKTEVQCLGLKQLYDRLRLTSVHLLSSNAKLIIPICEISCFV